MFAWLAETGGAAESITTQQCVDNAIANPDELGDLVFSRKITAGIYPFGQISRIRGADADRKATRHILIELRDF